MPLIGDLKDRITLLEPAYGTERTGQEQRSYVVRFDAWAAVESFDTRDVARFRQAGMKASAKLTIRQNLRIKDDWQVRHGGHVHQIEGISHSSDRRWTTLTIARLEQ